MLGGVWRIQVEVQSVHLTLSEHGNITDDLSGPIGHVAETCRGVQNEVAESLTHDARTFSNLNKAFHRRWHASHISCDRVQTRWLH